MISKGFVAVVSEPLSKETIADYIASWLSRFEKVEQITPESGKSLCAVAVTKPEDVMWETNLQFRVLNGLDFSWIYLTLNRQVIETSGLPADEISLCLDVLLELPTVVEIIEGHNDKRLDELEALGLL